MTVHVHRHNRSGARSDFRLNLACVQAPGMWIAVNKNWCRTSLDYGKGTGDDCESRHNNLITRLDSKTRHSNPQCRGSIANSHAIIHSAECRPDVLKFLNETAFGRDPARVYAFLDVLERLPT